MEEQEIYKRLNAIFRDVFDDESIVLTPETNADDIRAWDSFNHMNITVACEQTFGIRFKAAELEELKNVGELAELIQAKTN